MLRTLSFSAALISVPAAAEVVKATPAGFEIKQVVTVAAAPDRVWAVLVTPSR